MLGDLSQPGAGVGVVGLKGERSREVVWEGMTLTVTFDSEGVGPWEPRRSWWFKVRDLIVGKKGLGSEGPRRTLVMT